MEIEHTSEEASTLDTSTADTQESGSTELAVTGELLPMTLHILPLSERPFFPIQAMPLVVQEEPWLETISEIGNTEQRAVGLVLTKNNAANPPRVEDFHEIGTAIRMHQPKREQPGTIQFIAEGQQRLRIRKWISTEPPFVAQVEYLDDEETSDEQEVKAYAMAILAAIKELVKINPLYNEELKLYLARFTPNQPSRLADFAANLSTSSGEDLQDVLATLALRPRMERVLGLLKKELDVGRLQVEISQQVEKQMSEQQRKFFLKEQLKVIQQELGLAKDDRTADVERFRDRMSSLQPSEEASKRFDEEIGKLSVLESGSPEYAVTRNYLDWLTGLPWGTYSEDVLDLEHAQTVLDQDHAGLKDVKDRIIEFLAVGKLKGAVSGSILLLVGPPGVGKTSIGRSVANALGRTFYRFSVGGMRDEAEIKGHRRTYIGAMPGKFLQALKDVEVANPVIMLDEIDKVGASYQGDPASALLEILDPEQNASFLDHYLDLRFDLSRTLFICTANQLDTIPAPLLDRMETIRLSGYVAAEKVEIAKRHLWPKQRANAGLLSKQLTLSDAAIKRIVEGYAREAGVRNLEKQLSRIVRKAAVRIAGGENKPIKVSSGNIEEFLGPVLFRNEQQLAGPGVVSGLAWTALGGATLPVEASLVHRNSRGLKLTGRLGDVMQESAQIAYSYLSAHVAEFGAQSDFFDKALIHLHVPEGATPKDGPSAGITMASALLSLARNQRPPAKLAMTGELTLSGHVFPVGGIREKVIAAKRVGLKKLILPAANERDFGELPDFITKGLEIHYASTFEDVYRTLYPRG